MTGTIGANGAWSIANVPVLPGGSNYQLDATHPLYLAGRMTHTLNPNDNYTAPATTLRGGDANNDGAIGIGDVSCIGGAFGGTPTICGTTGSNDINADGAVNILDLVLAGGNYGLAAPDRGDVELPVSGQVIAREEIVTRVRHSPTGILLAVALSCGILLSLAAPQAAAADSRHVGRGGQHELGRVYHTATLLPDGRVLIAGGSDAIGPVSSVDLYNPADGEWTAAAPMSVARAAQTATLLANGRVLVAGGDGATGWCLATAELYDPITGTWTATGSMATPRGGHTATLLRDGRVLVTGGTARGVVDHQQRGNIQPGTGIWTPAGNMSVARVTHTASLLPDGKVLIAGGNAVGINYDTTELYDPVLNTWLPAAPMNTLHTYHRAVTLRDGRVLVAGGYTTTGSSILPAAEVYDPAANSWTATENMTQARVLPTRHFWRTAPCWLPADMMRVPQRPPPRCTTRRRTPGPPREA